MSEIKPVLIDNLNSWSQKNTKDFVLMGLQRKCIGLLVAPPDTGKSYFSISLGYELATTLPIIGLTEQSISQNVVYWPLEDGVAIASDRIQKSLDTFSADNQKLIGAHFFLYEGETPICSSKRLINTPEYQLVNEEKNRLIEKLIQVKADLLIIDTLRESIGSADEVEDDYQVKMVLEEIAHKANCAILAIHHPTKSVSRGSEDVSTVSPSGFSLLGSKSKLHLYLKKTHKKDITNLELIFSKANYIDMELRAVRSLYWAANSMLHANNLDLENCKAVKAVKAVKAKIAPSTLGTVKVSNEPKSIEIPASSTGVARRITPELDRLRSKALTISK
ncbi:AAA family ATPase [Shewanella xiamenensis]|uniref:AAA family ATPase n=1 Tax=Shewanella xiamenensis TaxID=332186 RepID=UPI002E7BE14B|nr:AAA family ATPase [Shewanella xiamenensis]